MRRSDGTPISEFLGTGTLSDSDLLTLVRSATNYRITIEDFKAALPTVTPQYGLVYMQGNATATTISTQGTPTLIAGTWQSGGLNGFTATAGGRLTYTGTPARVFRIDADMSARAASGQPDASVTIGKNGASIAATKIGNRMENTHDHNLSTGWLVSLSAGDYIELFIQNNSNTADFTVTSAVLRIS